MDKNVSSYHPVMDKTGDNPMNMSSYEAHLHSRNLAPLKFPYPDDGKQYMTHPDNVIKQVMQIPTSTVSDISLLQETKELHKEDSNKNSYCDLSTKVYDQTRIIMADNDIHHECRDLYRLPPKQFLTIAPGANGCPVGTCQTQSGPSLSNSTSTAISQRKIKKDEKEKPKRDRKVLHPQAKELILNVLNYMKDEANGDFVMNPRKIQGRTAKATGYSERTIRRVVKESKTAIVEGASSNAVSFQAKKTVKRPKPKTGLDALTRCSVRQLIHRIYVNEKTVPTIKKIHQKLVEEVNFKGGTRSAQKIVKELGFYWKKTKAKNYVMMEKHDIRLKRIKYLRDITRYRHEGRHIVYVADTIMYGTHTGKTQQVVTAIMACGDRGLIRESVYAVQGEADLSEHLEGWAREALVPYLPPHTVVVVDVSSKQEKVPTLDSDADAMKTWLNAKNIEYKPGMLRTELYQVIKRSACRLKKHKSVFERVLTEAGHSVLKMPDDHPDLNVASLIWADVNNTTTDPLNFDDAHFAVQVTNILCNIDVMIWTSRCSSVRMCEQQYLACEGIVDAQVERVLTAGKVGVAATSDVLDDPQENNINFVRHFMGGLLGLGEEQKSHQLPY